MASQITNNSNFCSTACWGYWLFVRGWRWISIIKGQQYGQPSQVMPSSRWSYLSSYPGYFREPHWFSMWPPGISRVTLTGIDDNVAPYTIILPTDDILNYFEETLELLSFSSQIRWRHQMETFSTFLVLREGNPPVTSTFSSQCQWRGALMFSLICAWTNNGANNRNAGDLRRHGAHNDVTVMKSAQVVAIESQWRLWHAQLK